MRLSRRFFFDDRGVALIMVLWIITFLSIIVSEFVFVMRVETQAVANYKNEAKAHYLALAGINLALIEVRGDYDFVYEDKDGRVAFAKREDGVLNTNEATREFVFSGGMVSYRIVDEKSKININGASRDVLINLLRMSGVESVERNIIVDSILDWRDRNHEFHLNGAEDDYYLALENPYESKDGFMDTVSELLLVKGMTPTVFYGNDNLPLEFITALNYFQDVSGREFAGIERFLTVNGNGRLNLNTAGEEVLEAVLGKGRAIEIMLRRETEGFWDHSVYNGVLSSKVFTVFSKGEVDGIEVEIKVVVERKLDGEDVKIKYWNEM